VHQEWEVPVPTTVTLESTEYVVAGLESATAVATVKDQYGRPYSGVAVDFAFSVPEGTITADGGPAAPIITDANGNASYTWTKGSGQWGVESVTATCLEGIWDEAKSATNVIQWIYADDTGGVGDWALFSGVAFPASLLNADQWDQEISVAASMEQWDGKTLTVYLNPGANVVGALGSKTYDDANILYIATNLHTWDTIGEGFFVKANSTNSDHIPNWVYEVVGPE